MRTRIGLRGRDYDLLSPGEDPEDATVLRFGGFDDALLFLRGLASDPLALMRIRGEVARFRGAAGAVSMSDRDTLVFLARLLETDRVKLAVRPVEAGGGGSADMASEVEAQGGATSRSFGSSATPSQMIGRGREESPPPPSERVPPPPAPVAQSKTHWIEIQLLGEDDEPIPDMRYVLNLPDGREMSGRLDGEGFARVDGISQTGSCKISLPDLDKGAWEHIDSLGPR